MQNLFFELIQVTLGNRKYLSKIPTPQEWEALSELAAKQSLSGICLSAIQKMGGSTQVGWRELGIDQMFYVGWLGKAALIRKRNEELNSQCLKLQKKINEGNIRSCIFKGQTVGSLYGDLAMFRQPGDIDIYLDCGREKTMSFLKSIGMCNLKWDYVHTHAPFFPNTTVEVHYSPGAIRNPWKNARLQKFWQQNNEDFFGGLAFLPEGQIVCPTSKMHIFYLIHHTYRHLISSGIGLRQLMDVYFALQARDIEDDPWIQENVDRFGMKRFCKAMMWVMKEVFGAEIDRLPWTPDEKEGKFLLDEIMIGGNFGNSDIRFGKGSSKVKILAQIAKRNWHLASHYGKDALAAPIYYIWHYCWKRLHNMK